MMRALYLKLRNQDNTIKNLTSVIIIYGLAGIISFVGIKTGQINITSDGYLSFEVSTIIGAIIIPIAILYTLLIEILPIIIGVTTFLLYNTLFSKSKTIFRIIPIKNVSHLMKVIKVMASSVIAYLLITIIISSGADSADAIQIGKYFLKIFAKNEVAILLAFNSIIIDIFCRESNLKWHSEILWIAIFISIGMSITTALLSADIVFAIVILTLLIIIQTIYIFKEVKTIKIN